MQPVDGDFIRWFATLGVGGVLAGFMFIFYRKDVKQYTELWKSVAMQVIDVIKDNTASNVKLINLIESQERNAMRKGDVENLIEMRISSLERTRQRNRMEQDVQGRMIDDKS